MKKVLLGIICLLAFSLCTVGAAELPKKTDHEKVTIYLFRGSGCSHCYEALQYFTNFFEVNKEYNDYMQIKTYEVWYDANNQALLQAVLQELDGTDKSGVPYIVIGNSYHSAGFAESLSETIIEAALSEYENKDYEDVVARIASSIDTDANVASLEEAAVAEGITSDYSSTSTSDESNHSSDGWIIAGIFVVVIGGMVALVALSKKKN